MSHIPYNHAKNLYLPNCKQSHLFSFTTFPDSIFLIVIPCFFLYNSINYRRTITMDIEIRPRNKFKELLSNLHDKSEDILFFLIRKAPDKLIPPFIMNWFEKYLDKRSKELQQEIIRQQWRQIYLEKTIEEIQSIQKVKKAQSED